MDSQKTTSYKEMTPIWVLLICYVFIFAAAFHGSTKVIGGGDTWVAMACGRYYTEGDWAVRDKNRTLQMKLLDSFGVHITHNDPFSLHSRGYDPDTHGEEGWINQNWLTHVIFYQCFKTFGGSAIVVYKFLMSIFTVLFIFWAARTAGIHPIIAAATAATGILMSRSFIDLRPNVASILFAAAMMLIIHKWKKGQVGSIFWMLPLMILWSNIHGGFIYGIVVFIILVSGHGGMLLLQKLFADRFEIITIKQWKYLIAGVFIVLIIPVLFSPFGLDNLLHPLLVTSGEDAKIWRSVAEWKSIFDKQHFGNAEPYKIFLIVLSLIFILHLIFILFYKPKAGKKTENLHGLTVPKLDLAYLGIILFTVLISCKSSRFVYLSSVVSSLYMALMIDQLITIWLIRKGKKNIKSKELFLSKFFNVFGPIIVTAGVLIITAVSYRTVQADYFLKDNKDEKPLFYKMVAYSQTCEKAMTFVNANNISGVVFGEWTNGGYIPFAQKLNDGKPPLKVFIDGRAQAAYDIRHYKIYHEINRHIKGLPKKKSAYLNHYNNKKLPQNQKTGIIKQIKAIDRQIKQYMPRLLKHGISAVLLRLDPAILNGFALSDDWVIVYADHKNMLFLNSLVPLNKPVINKNFDNLKFPDKDSKQRTIQIKQYVAKMKNR